MGDLNRNYDFNWAVGGDDNPSSWFYRGPYPFSEKETQALRDLTLRENFVFGIGYHSFGETILFPWGNFTEPPDLELIVELAEAMASRIKKQSGKGSYSVLPLNGRVGQSSVWMYGAAGVIDFIVETGDEYFPPGKEIEKIAQENAKAAFFLLDRVFGPGVTGHIYDADNGRPLVAQVQILELRSPVVKPRTSEPRYGRYFRILRPGRYEVEFSAPGYIPQVFENVIIDAKEHKVLDVFLHKKRTYVPLGNE
ncbi:MAG: M14 family zinc carboxypeptidase [candidate division KSB1 bacterium]|nr:M14 family zinc carboxypeptidase [candidate division KSB1 bacterium]